MHPHLHTCYSSTPYNKLFSLLTHILTILTPKYHIGHDALEIPNINVANVGCFGLPRVKNLRSISCVIVDVSLGTNDTKPRGIGVPSAWHIPIPITMHGKSESLIKIH